MRRPCVLFLSLFFSASNLTAMDFEDGTFPELIPSGRALAMGNAFIARVDDESAPFYNPAGLGSMIGWAFHLNNFLVESNKDFAKDVTADTQDAFKIIKNSFDLDELRQFHLRNPGSSTYTRLSLAPNFTTRFLSFGYLYSQRARTFYAGGNDDDFEFSKRKDHGPYVGGNLSISGGIFKIGGSLVWLNRTEVIGKADESTTLNLAPTQKSKGSMLLTIFGGRLTFPIKGLPTLAVTLHNASDKDFHRSNDSFQAPPSIKQNLVLGASITPIIGRKQKIHIEINYKDVNKKYDDLKSSKRWTGGVEFNFSRIFFVRGGYYDGFFSGGLGIKIKTFRFDLSTYATEKGPRSPDTEDRRFLISTSFNL